MSSALAGDVVWFRDVWGVPSVMTVDMLDGSDVIGMSGRKSFVRILLSKCYPGLHDLQGKAADDSWW